MFLVQSNFMALNPFSSAIYAWILLEAKSYTGLGIPVKDMLIFSSVRLPIILVSVHK